MEHFVTIININYLLQSLCLYKSLEDHHKNFTLWVISLDEKLEDKLKIINKKNIKIVSHKKFETRKLKELKKIRTISEYCWTLTPIAPKIIFDIKKNLDRVTYIDADMFFFRNSNLAFEEFENSRKSILITEHDFDDDQFYKKKKSGKYIVQFLIFKRNKSEKLRKWWEDKCINECSSKKTDDSGIGDQKYLEEMSNLFKEDVYVLKNNDLFRSTWNFKKFNKKKISAWHFHGLKIINQKLVFLSGLDNMPDNIFIDVYLPYLKSLRYNLDKYKLKIQKTIEKDNFLKDLFIRFYYFLIEKKIIKNSKYYNLENLQRPF